MTETIPGGRRQRASSEGDILEDDDDDGLYHADVGTPLNSGRRKVSTSGVLTTVERGYPKDDTYSDVHDERPTMGPSERRTKSRKTSFKSIKKLMNRVMKSSSSANSINEQDANPNSRVTWTPTLRRRNDSTNEGSDLRSSKRGGKHEKVESTIRPLITKPGFTGPKWEKTPMTVGLHNHGNTCFMNAVLQCLSNTDSFVEYFVDGMFDDDLRNLRNIKKGGVRVDVTEHIAKLEKCLWSNRYNAQVSGEFKAIVGKANSQYEGSSQHDAQEFLLWLLDRLHEDLNTNVKKKNKPLKNSATRSDEELAQEALTSRHGSFVSQLFQALHRSSLTCPHCSKQSNTFDPYLLVSLPLPQKCPRPVFVTVVFGGQRQLKIGLRMNTFECVRDLRHRISTELRVPEKQMVLCQVSDDGFKATYSDDQPLSDIPETDTVHVFETFAENEPSSASARYETPYIQILVVHTERATSPPAYYRFCSPTVLRIPRDFNYKRLQKEILHNMGEAVKQEVFGQKNVLFRLRVVDSRPSKSYLPTNVEMPLYTQAVDNVLAFYGEDYGPSHMKLVAEWDTQTKEMFVVDDEDDVEEHSSVHQMRISQHLNPSASLDECFRLYTQEEKLSGEDAWLCPHCKKQQQGTIKTLGLWSLPDILVIHLKRFKQVGMRRNKLNTLISFPVENLDMTNHVVTKLDRASLKGGGDREGAGRNDDLVYDLFAVCNHYGNMNGGHYTAFCKNPIDGQWHEYDDTRVKNIPETQVTTKAAYLLFYQRRSLTKICNQNLHTGNHWAFRMFAQNNNNNNNNHPPASPSSPSSAKSVHFDTSSPQQIPRHKPLTPAATRRETGDGNHPIKPILRPLTPQPPRRHNYSPQEIDCYDRSPSGHGREFNQEFRVRQPLVRQHSEPEPHKGMGACFSLSRPSEQDSDMYRQSSSLPAERHHHSSAGLNGHEHPDSSTFRRSQRHFERSKPNFSNELITHKPPRPNEGREVTPDHSSQRDTVKAVNGSSSNYSSSPNESPSHAPTLSRPKPPPPPKDKTAVMVVESKLIAPPNHATATPVHRDHGISQERRMSADRVLETRNVKTHELRDTGSARNSEEREIPGKYATLATGIQKHIKTFENMSSSSRESATLSRPPRPNTVQKQARDSYHDPFERDTISIASLSHRQARSRANVNIDQRDSVSVRSFGDQTYNGYARKDNSASRGAIRYRPHIHRGNMFAQMNARRSVEVPAPCLKESSV